MRVYRRSEFMKLPEGIFFCSGRPWHFGAIQRKGETTEFNDWFEMAFNWIEGFDTGECFERLDSMLRDGVSFPMQDSECRNGSFDDSDLFLVLERADLVKLRDYVTEAISVSEAIPAGRDGEFKIRTDAGYYLGKEIKR